MKKILSIILCIVFSLTLISTAGCTNNNPNTGDGNTGKVMINGFENFERDVQLIRMFNEFGIIDQNSNKTYVKSGEKSLKLTPLGDRMSSANPYIMLPSASIRFEEIAYSDFSEVKKVSMWFYNAEATPVNVGIAFGKSPVRMDTSTRRDYAYKTGSEYFSLVPGWNFVELDFNHMLMTLQGLKLNEVYGIVIEMDYVVSHKLADSPEVYVDDVCLEYGSKQSTAFDMTVKTGTTDEGNPYWTICDFENALEQYYFYYNYTFPSPPQMKPIVRTVFAGDHGIATEKGSQVLLIQKKHGGTYYGWPVLTMPGEIVKKVISAIGQDVQANPQNYAIKFDVYNGCNYANGWNTWFYKDFKDGTGNAASVWDVLSVSVSPYQWKTFSKNLGDLNALAENVLNKDPNATIIPYNQNPTGIELRMGGFYNDEDISDRPVFLDNVRIEKIA